MIIKRFELINCRNIEHEVIEPCEGVNIIYGENAQGKTNLIEGLWMFTGCRSFRGAKDNEILRFGTNKMILSLDYFGKGRDQNFYLEVTQGRNYTQNGVKLNSMNRVISEVPCVVFSPKHLSLIKEGPAERRRFMDVAIAQQDQYYAGTVVMYNRAVAQRNQLLKDVNDYNNMFDLLPIWEEKIAEFGAEIIERRYAYIKKLEQAAEEIYSGLSSDREKLTISYKAAAESGTMLEMKAQLIEKYKETRYSDIRAGVTVVGPHRDDLDIKINGISARSYGSQGQQRSCALSLKLGEAAVVKQNTGEQPVALLDDVMSELDTSRQNYILNHIKDWQVFITCCEPSSVKNMKYGKAFLMKSGKVFPSDQ